MSLLSRCLGLGGRFKPVKPGHRLFPILVTPTAITCLACAAPAHRIQSPSDTVRGESAPFGYDVRADFLAFDPQYRDRINKYKDELDRLQQEMTNQARAGRKTTCLRQIFVEAHWLVYYTANYEKIDKRINDLRDML